MPARRPSLRGWFPRPIRRGPATIVLLSSSVLAAAPPQRGRLEPGFGVTPGGLVWTVEPKARRIVLRDPDGSVRESFPAGDEGHVLGVADSGARVTSPSPDGFRHGPARSGEEKLVEARFVFRRADGSVRATAGTTAARGSRAAFYGDAAWLLRRSAGRWSVVRVAPEGETSVASISDGDLRRHVGTPSSPELFAGPSGVAALFHGARGDAAVDAARPERVATPDPLDACGEGRPRLVLPRPDGLLVVSVRTSPAPAGEEERGEPVAVAELMADSGRVARSEPLGPWNELFPMPDGGLLALDGMQAVRWDDRFVEVSRAVLPLVEGADPSATARVVEQLHRLDALGPRATGADWAELALLDGARPWDRVEIARRDPEGALARLARVVDGEPGTSTAAKAVALLLDFVAPEERARLIASLRERVEAGAPLWLRRAAAFALLSQAPREAPSWALPAVAEAIGNGAADDCFTLADDAYTPELAELVTAVDRARIDRLAAASPELTESVMAGSLDAAFQGSSEGLRFHAPAARFARTLLDCSAGPPSAAGLLALWRVAETAFDSAAAFAAPHLPRAAESALAPDERGALAEALLDSRQSPDAELRASALAAGPLVGFPIDPGQFRSEVLSRPHLGAIATLGLLSDRSLSPRDWTGLFTQLFASARSASRDPSACALFGGRGSTSVEERQSDRYCNLFMLVRADGGDLAGEEEAPLLPRERLALLADFARSSSAPPELRLDIRLGRAFRGTATEDDVIEILGERDLAPVYRRIVLGKLPPGSPRLAAFLERELSAGRVPAPERGTWLDALAQVDPAAGDRLAAEAWSRGTVPLDGDDGEAGAYCRALAPERVLASETLRAALRNARDLPAASLEAATALARAGDDGSAGPLVTALLESCPACHSPADLAALFGPLGEEGLESLARLAEATLPFGTSPLEALFELRPSRAEEIGRSRLADALRAGCVPEPLLPALLAHEVDPFPDVLSALVERGCDRSRLRPGEGVAAGVARPAATDAGRAARRALDSAPSASCRAAFASLLGIPAKDAPAFGGAGTE